MTALWDVSRATNKRRTDKLMPHQIASKILAGGPDVSTKLPRQHAGELSEATAQGKEPVAILAHVIRSQMLEESAFGL